MQKMHFKTSVTFESLPVGGKVTAGEFPPQFLVRSMRKKKQILYKI
jgi:hypothetical protein